MSQISLIGPKQNNNNNDKLIHVTLEHGVNPEKICKNSKKYFKSATLVEAHWIKMERKMERGLRASHFV